MKRKLEAVANPITHSSTKPMADEGVLNPYLYLLGNDNRRTPGLTLTR